MGGRENPFGGLSCASIRQHSNPSKYEGSAKRIPARMGVLGVQGLRFCGLGIGYCIAVRASLASRGASGSRQRQP